MHELIKAGLDIMRDPNTKQEFGQGRNNDGNLCAMGCFMQATVDAGLATWKMDGGDWFIVPTEDASVWETPERYIEARSELSDHVLIGVIIRLNDDDRAPLPRIADVIESAYKQEAE
jgi:hypothetical protein